MPAAPARRPLTRRALVAAATALVIAIVMLSMETAYAMWQDQADTDAGAIATGTAELTADWSGEVDSSSWQNLIPGDTEQRDITVKNGGDVPLALHAVLLSAPAGIELRMNGGSEDGPGPALSATLQPLSESGAPLVLEPHETASIQVVLTATPELSSGQQQLKLMIELEGRQVA